MSHTHLFLFTIGPVQSFISQARKTQDLYAGSQILSQLIQTGIKEFNTVFDQADSEIIYPATAIIEDAQTDQIISLPNRIFARIRNHQLTDDELHDKAKTIRSAVKEVFQSMGNEVLHKVNLVDEKAPAGFYEQVGDHLETHWAWQKVESDFLEAYSQLEMTGGAIKNIRQFSQIRYGNKIGEQGRKCNIDGRNQALFYRPLTRQNGQKNKYGNAVELRNVSLNPGEGLGAVSMVKRFFKLKKQNKFSFPSTAEVALMEDEANLSPAGKKVLDEFKILLAKPNSQIDYQLLFEENLTEDNITNPSQLETLKKKQAVLSKELSTRYYAIVLFDGDEMGKWLKGGVKIQDPSQLEGFHTALSTALSRYAQKARPILDSPENDGRRKGWTIYTGGDDFLGFVNIHHIYSVMKDLRQAFDRVINHDEKVLEHRKQDQRLTFSAGIVIAHYKTPFSEVLKKVRYIESQAKNKADRNAFAIAVLKHSGEVQECFYKWGTDQSSAVDCSNWEALEQLTEALRSKEEKESDFSNSFIFNLTSELRSLAGTELDKLDADRKEESILEEAIKVEIKRLIQRSNKHEQGPDKTDKLVRIVLQLWEQAPEPRIRNFLHALHIADFLTRKTQS